MLDERNLQAIVKLLQEQKAEIMHEAGALIEVNVIPKFNFWWLNQRPLFIVSASYPPANISHNLDASGLLSLTTFSATRLFPSPRSIISLFYETGVEKFLSFMECSRYKKAPTAAGAFVLDETENIRPFPALIVLVPVGIRGFPSFSPDSPGCLTILFSYNGTMQSTLP